MFGVRTDGKFTQSIYASCISSRIRNKNQNNPIKKKIIPETLWTRLNSKNIEMPIIINSGLLKKTLVKTNSSVAIESLTKTK